MNPDRKKEINLFGLIVLTRNFILIKRPTSNFHLLSVVCDIVGNDFGYSLENKQFPLGEKMKKE